MKTDSSSNARYTSSTCRRFVGWAYSCVSHAISSESTGMSSLKLSLYFTKSTKIMTPSLISSGEATWSITILGSIIKVAGTFSI